MLVKRYIIIALSLLAQSEDSAVAISQAGALGSLLAAAKSSDFETKASCCRLLTLMTYHPRCRDAVAQDLRVISVLIELSKIKHPELQLLCASAFANLSVEESLHDPMIEQGLLSILNDLSNSYSEAMQQHCARALGTFNRRSLGFEYSTDIRQKFK